MFGLSKRMLIVIGVLVLVVVVFIIQSKNNPNGNSSNSGTTTTNSGQCQVRVTADVLHVRTSPDPNASIVKSLSNGVVVGAEKTVQNGFRQLGDNQWVSSQFVTPVSGSC